MNRDETCMRKKCKGLSGNLTAKSNYPHPHDVMYCPLLSRVTWSEVVQYFCGRDIILFTR